MTKSTTYSLIAFTILLTVGSYFYIAIPDCLHNRAVCFQSQSPAPYRYRILQPALEHLIAPSGEQDATLFADFILQALLTPVIIIGLWQWLKRWTDDTRALIGVLLFTIVNIASYHFYMRAISTTIEIACIVWALVYIDQFWIVALLTLIASMNRETGVIFIALYAFYYGKPSWNVAILGAIFNVVFIIIHLVFGTSDHILGLAGTFQYNLQNLPDAILTNILLLPLVVAVAVAYKSSLPTLKRLLWVAALYCGAIAVAGAWNESLRLILPVLPIALAAVMVKPVEKFAIDGVYPTRHVLLTSEPKAAENGIWVYKGTQEAGKN